MTTGYLLIDGNAAMGREPAKSHHWLVALMAVIVAQWIFWQGSALGRYVGLFWSVGAEPSWGVEGLVVSNLFAVLVPSALILPLGLFILRRFDQRSAKSIGLDARTPPLAVAWVLVGLIAAVPHMIAIAVYLPTGEGWLVGSALLTAITVVQAGAEEVLFRGLILGFLCARYGVRQGIVISALLFGFWHIYLGQGIADAVVLFVTTFAFGVTSAVLTLHYGNIGPALGLHIVWNVASSLSAAAMLGSDPFWNAWVATFSQPWTWENIANGNVVRFLLIPLVIETLLIFGACRDTVQKVFGAPGAS